MKTEFIIQGTTAHLYVDGQKTNTWFASPTHKYYDMNTDLLIGQRMLAETIKMLIDTGQITSDHWEDWDIGHCCLFKIENLGILNPQSQLSSENVFLSCTGYQDYSDLSFQRQIINEYTGKFESVQWKRRIIGQTISSRAAIKFFPCGYQLGFIATDCNNLSNALL